MPPSKLTTKQIKQRAKEKLAGAPGGLRWTNLVNDIHAESPETPINTIWGSTRSLFKDDTDILKISKGLYSLVSVADAAISAAPADAGGAAQVIGPTGSQVSEADFYLPFAEWLVGLDEVTEAIPIGGNIFKGKWNTPDVIGVLRPLKGDLIKFESQIVSAEIKIDPSQPVTAFGQAISYRLFSHKCYLVIPRSTAADDLDRIEALAIVFGLGIVLFDVVPEAPGFSLFARASLAQPDMVYVNQMAQRLNAHDSKAFDRLF